MMFTMIFAVTTMICCVLFHGGRSEELSNLALELFSVRSGHFDNHEQIGNGLTENDLMECWFIPAQVPVFGSKPVLLFMEAKKGTLLRIQLHVVSSTEGDTINITPYNFTDPSLYKPGEFSLKALENLTFDQLHTDPDCVLTYVRNGPRDFTVTWPDCLIKVRGKHPLYEATFNCDEIVCIMPKGAIERHGFRPFDFKRTGDKYKLVNAPDNYVGPCDKQP